MKLKTYRRIYRYPNSHIVSHFTILFSQICTIHANKLIQKKKKNAKKKTIYILTLLVFAARNKWMPLISTIFHRRKWPKPWICWEIWL